MLEKSDYAADFYSADVPILSGNTTGNALMCIVDWRDRYTPTG